MVEDFAVCFRCMDQCGKFLCFRSYNVENEPFWNARDKVEYFVWYTEVCLSTSCSRLQGFVVFRKCMKRFTVQNFTLGVDIEKIHGTVNKAIDYFMKDENLNSLAIYYSFIYLLISLRLHLNLLSQTNSLTLNSAFCIPSL